MSERPASRTVRSRRERELPNILANLRKDCRDSSLLSAAELDCLTANMKYYNIEVNRGSPVIAVG